MKNELVSLSSIGLLTTPLYIYIYKNDINMTWILFVLDRIVTLIIGYKIENILNFIDFEILNEAEKSEVRIFSSITSGICVIGIFMITHILYKYPKLCALLILGKFIDKLIRKILKIYIK